MSHLIQEENNAKRGLNTIKVPYKPIIKNINLDFYRKNQPINHFIQTNEYYRNPPKYNVSIPQREHQKNRGNLPYFNQRSKNAFPNSMDRSKTESYAQGESDHDDVNQHKRAISLFRMRIKKNQMFLPRKKQQESSNKDSFLFSFYNPKQQNNSKQVPHEETFLTKGHSMTYDNAYIID